MTLFVPDRLPTQKHESLGVQFTSYDKMPQAGNVISQQTSRCIVLHAVMTARFGVATLVALFALVCVGMG